MIERYETMRKIYWYLKEEEKLFERSIARMKLKVILKNMNIILYVKIQAIH